MYQVYGDFVPEGSDRLLTVDGERFQVLVSTGGGLTINLYQCSAEVNRVDKTNYLTQVGTLLGALRTECSLITPSIVYQSEDVPTYNYVHIPDFNRYYFVTSLVSVGKNLWRMELNCDVLMSYKTQILHLEGVIARQETDNNPMLVDGSVEILSDPIIEIKQTTLSPFTPEQEDPGGDLPDIGKIRYNIVLQVAREVSNV